MKLSFRLCFLVLVISSVSRGQTPTDPPGTKDVSSANPEPAETGATTENENYNTSQAGTPSSSMTKQTMSETMSPKPPESKLPASTAPILTKITVPDGDIKSTSDKKEVTSVATTTGAAQVAPSKAGYVVLVLIIIIIIILCVILYMLRRASRTYSLDLHTPGPSRHRDEPIGTFEQVYVDDLNQPAPKDLEMTEDLTTTPVANGTSPEPLEKGSSEENVVPQDSPEKKDVQNSPSSSSSSSSDDRAEETSDKQSSNNLFFDATEEQQQNENNNNPTVGSSCLFVEINLDEPAWCDQLLASPPPSSSVCLFSSSSLPSSSS